MLVNGTEAYANSFLPSTTESLVMTVKVVVTSNKESLPNIICWTIVGSRASTGRSNQLEISIGY